MELKQQFKTKYEYVPIQFKFEDEGWLFTALRGPDNGSDSPKELGTAIVRSIMGFEYGIVNNPVSVHKRLSSYRTDGRFDSDSYLMHELMTVQGHYANHVLRAFRRLEQMTDGQEKRYFLILTGLWLVIQEDSGVPSIISRLEALWNFLEHVDHLDDEYS